MAALFAWQVWHLATCCCTLRGRRGTLRHPPSFRSRRGTYGTGLALVARSVPSSRRGRGFLRGRRGTWRHVAVLCVAGVAFCGRRGTLRYLPSFHVAGVARMALEQSPWTPRLFAWQAWHFETSNFVSRGSRPVVRRCPCCSMWLLPCLEFDPDSVYRVYRL